MIKEHLERLVAEKKQEVIRKKWQAAQLQATLERLQREHGGDPQAVSKPTQK